MAKSLGYTPPTPPDTAPDDALRDLVLALHESGLLRAAAGGVRRYPDLVHAALASDHSQEIRSLIVLLRALGDLDPGQAERIADGIRDAREAAPRAAQDPRSTFGLLAQLRDPDTRRGLSAALAGLKAFGAAIGREDDRTG